MSVRVAALCRLLVIVSCFALLPMSPDAIAIATATAAVRSTK
jgi:hypothetical protein